MPDKCPTCKSTKKGTVDAPGLAGYGIHCGNTWHHPMTRESSTKVRDSMDPVTYEETYNPREDYDTLALEISQGSVAAKQALDRLYQHQATFVALAAEHDRLIKENERLRTGLEDAARDIEGWNMFIGSGALKAIARRARAALQEEQG